MRELQKSKPRTGDENLQSEMARLESALQVARDDLGACKLKLTGVKDELKTLDRQLKETSPQLRRAKAVLDALLKKVNALAAVVDEAEVGFVVLLIHFSTLGLTRVQRTAYSMRSATGSV
jgi:structural maintenance of chromosome 1